jgi:hypothetical protein
MNRFQKLQTVRELIDHIIVVLEEDGYNQIPDCTGGDQDFLMIDTLRKEYIWCENGFSPFCSDEEMAKYQFSCKQTTLKDLEENRY